MSATDAAHPFQPIRDEVWFYDVDPGEPERGKRGMRLAVGRRAAGRGFKVDIGYGDGFLVVRKSQDPYAPKQARAEAPPVGNGRRARRKRQQGVAMAPTPGDRMAGEDDVPAS